MRNLSRKSLNAKSFAVRRNDKGATFVQGDAAFSPMTCRVYVVLSLIRGCPQRSSVLRAKRSSIFGLILISLFVGEIDQDPEHLAILLDAIGVRIASEDLLRHCQVFLAEEEP